VAEEKKLVNHCNKIPYKNQVGKKVKNKLCEITRVPKKKPEYERGKRRALDNRIDEIPTRFSYIW
jgi:hypothetical protein